MLCQICNKKEATIHLTQMLDDDIRKLHLCEKCAAESGIDVNVPASMTNYLLGLETSRKDSPESVKRTCPRCGMRFSDFKKISRLGCQNCYVVFAGELDGFLSGVQKGNRHVGKKPLHHAAAVNILPSLASLKESLKEAVASENYEEAARIRDQLQQVENDAAPVGKERHQ